MKFFKMCIVTFIILIQSGCGAEINYNLNVDTNKEEIQIFYDVKIEEEDYKNIEGGKERLVEVIQKNKPEYVNFSMDEKNSNIFKFSMICNSYEDYKAKFKSLTGKESKTVFTISDFSEESPFISSIHIEFDDELEHLLDWLKNGLIKEGIVSKENESKLIQKQSYVYSFNNKKANTYSSKKMYDGKKNINVLQNDVSVIIKKDNKIDFLLNFYVAEDDIESFISNFEKYLDNTDIDYNYEKVEDKINETDCMKFTISLNSLDLSDENDRLKVNSLYGKEFSSFHTTVEEKGNFIAQQYNQSLNISLNLDKLFNQSKYNPTNITIDLDGVKYNGNENIQEFEFPYTIDTLNNPVFQYVIPTTYKNLNYVIIIGFFIAFIIVARLIRQKGFNET